MTAQPTAGELPRRLGRYLLWREVARGGMATVYLGRRADLDAAPVPLAVKVLHDDLAEQPQQVEQFEREAEVLAALDHRCVVRGLDRGVVEGHHFLVMEHLAGETLAAVMKACPPDRPPRALLAYVIAEAAEGLHAVHHLPDASGYDLGLVHRDLSPRNVIVTYDGAVKLVDLGLVAPARGGRSVRDPGKPAYMSPEQHLGRRIDQRADIYALGVILWEAAVLRRLFESHDDAVTKARVIGHDIPPLSRIDPEVPRRLETTVVRALRQDPEERHPTAAALAAELRRFVAETGEAMDERTVAAWMAPRFDREIQSARRAIDSMLHR